MGVDIQRQRRGALHPVQIPGVQAGWTKDPVWTGAENIASAGDNVGKCN